VGEGTREVELGTLTAITAIQKRRLREQFHAFTRAAKVPQFRTMKEFAESEIRCPPNGPRAGEMFNSKTQPWTGHWLDAVDSYRYVFHVLVAIVQGGKTLCGWVIPAMYHLFERNESVTCAVPDMGMAFTKWDEDFLPILKASRYAHLLPTQGVGSKGGKKFSEVTFLNGAKLKFVGAAGSDTGRSGFTTKVLVMTEVNKMRALSTSKEAGPIAQFFARLKAHEMERMRIFLECTVDDENGEIWTRYIAGTASRAMVPCPKCGKRVCLERSELRGWQNAADEIAAREMAHYVCPSCEAPWTEEERKQANRLGVLVARGQQVTDDGKVIGDSPRTLTFSMRANIADSNLKPAKDVGWEEWDAKYNPDDEGLKEKTLQQFTWVMPWGGEAEHEGISPDIVASRLSGIDRGVLPEDVETLVVQIDIHQKWHVWTLLATGPHNVRSYIDYGISLNPDPRVVGPEQAIRRGLELLADDLETREYVTDQGRVVYLDLGLVDGGYYQNVALEFVTSRGGLWRLVKGQGKDEKQVKLDANKYKKPEKRTADVRPGDHWFDSRQPAVEESDKKKWWLVVSDTNHWMHTLHDGFMKGTWLTDDKGIVQYDEFGQPIRRPGSCALFGESAEEHLRNLDEGIPKSNFATQVCGWVWKSVKTAKKGEQIGWHPQWASHDHFGDTGYGCLVADSVVRAYSPRFKRKAPLPKPLDDSSRFTVPDGRPYLLTER
jgi:hypothetical protein